MKVKTKKLIFYLLLFLLVCLGLFLLGSRIKAEAIIRLVEKSGVWAPLVFILVYPITHIIAPISGTPFFFAGYILFKKKVSFYLYFATLLGSTANFWISKIWGRGLVSKLVGKKNIEKIDQLSEDYGIKSLIFLRLFQGYLHDFVSYAYGLTKMNYLPFILVTALCQIASLLLWQLFIFEQVTNIRSLVIWYVSSLLPLYIVSIFLISKFRKKK